jgi:hypothetical protein
VSAPSLGAASLPDQVKSTREQLLTLLREADPPAAKWVEDIRRTRPRKPSVVVVGETNCGKSSLVNALLAMPAGTFPRRRGRRHRHLPSLRVCRAVERAGLLPGPARAGADPPRRADPLGFGRA